MGKIEIKTEKDLGQLQRRLKNLNKKLGQRKATAKIKYMAELMEGIRSMITSGNLKIEEQIELYRLNYPGRSDDFNWGGFSAYYLSSSGKLMKRYVHSSLDLGEIDETEEYAIKIRKNQRADIDKAIITGLEKVLGTQGE